MPDRLHPSFRHSSDAESIPPPAAGDKAERPDLLVLSDPVWEKAFEVASLPSSDSAAIDPIRVVHDGGGSALNSACALARAGRRVVAAGHVGDDRAGWLAIEALERHGVRTCVEIIPGLVTKQNELFVEKRSARNAFRSVTAECRPPGWGKDPPHLLESKLLLLDRLSPHAPRWLRARRRTESLVNIATRYDRSMVHKDSEEVDSLLSAIDILQLPERSGPEDGREAEPADTPGKRMNLHTPSAPPPLTDREIDLLLRSGARILIRTRGAGGVILHSTGDAPLVLPAQRTRVVDPTGAGDAFTAGFLDRMLSGDPLRQAAEQGLDWAARAVRHLGARGWLEQEPPEDRCNELS